MSRKRKPNRGNPRASRDSARATDPKTPGQPHRQSNTQPNKPPQVFIVTDSTTIDRQSLEPIPARTKDEGVYRVKGLKIFAREMRMITGEFYPDPETVFFEHENFKVQLIHNIKAKLPAVARTLQDAIEEFFRNRLASYDTPEDFDTWDKVNLDSFFADQRLVQIVESDFRIIYDDRIKDGPQKDDHKASHCNIGYKLIDGTDGPTYEAVDMQLLSTVVTEAINQGYPYEAIVDGIARDFVGYKILEYASRTQIVEIDDTTKFLNLGISGMLLDNDNNFLRVPMNLWSQRGFLTALHARHGANIGIRNRAEFALLELLKIYEPKLYQKLFTAIFADGDNTNKLNIVNDTMKHFIDTEISGDAQLKEELELLVNGAIYSDRDVGELFSKLRTLLIDDEKWGDKLRMIIGTVAQRELDFMFLDPPAIGQRITLGIIAD